MKYIARKPNDLSLPDDFQIVMTIMAWPEDAERKGENLQTDVLVFNTYSEAADTIYNLLEGEGVHHRTNMLDHHHMCAKERHRSGVGANRC